MSTHLHRNLYINLEILIQTPNTSKLIWGHPTRATSGAGCLSLSSNLLGKSQNGNRRRLSSVVCLGVARNAYQKTQKLQNDNYLYSLVNSPANFAKVKSLYISSRSNEERLWRLSWNYSVRVRQRGLQHYCICFVFLCKTHRNWIHALQSIWIPLLRCRPPMERALHLPCGGRARNYLNKSEPFSPIPWKLVQSSSQISNALKDV